MKNVLVINAGSSSLKYQLIDMDDADVIAKGLVERIGIDGSVIKHKPSGTDKAWFQTFPVFARLGTELCMAVRNSANPC